MKSLSVLICVMFFLSTPIFAQFSGQKKIAVHATPEDATISDIIPGTKELRQLGIGTAVVMVPKNGSVTIVLKKNGFADLKKTYSTLLDEKLPREDFLAMKDRAVNLKVWPADAIIISNGIELEKGSAMVIVTSGEQVKVEVKKNGFVSVSRTYFNQSDAEPPPANDEIKLKDRIIQVAFSPSDAKILIDNMLVGSGNGDVIVPFDRCVVVKVMKEGYVELEQTYCNKEDNAELPVRETLTLQDRMVMVRTTPEDVTIKINGRYVAKGEYNVKIPKGECVEVAVEKEGSAAVRKNYCNQENAPVLPVVDHIDLVVDETYALSSLSDSVNANIILDIKHGLSEAEAWKTMSQIVLNVFDVIEIADKETGYLRTAWTVKTFPNNTIRTRIIVKVADSSQLKYSVKLCSESSGRSGSNANDDGLFSEWNRVLFPYMNVVSNIKLRLE